MSACQPHAPQRVPSPPQRPAHPSLAPSPSQRSLTTSSRSAHATSFLTHPPFRPRGASPPPISRQPRHQGTRALSAPGSAKLAALRAGRLSLRRPSGAPVTPSHPHQALHRPTGAPFLPHQAPDGDSPRCAAGPGAGPPSPSSPAVCSLPTWRVVGCSGGSHLTPSGISSLALQTWAGGRALQQAASRS